MAKRTGIDPDAAEAAGLAHDLGHPPFGHIAEKELDRLVRKAGVLDGFEGNAQSFRIVAFLASSDARDNDEKRIPGLNLTRRTLDGILKYPWLYDDAPDEFKRKKWGCYATEQTLFSWIRQDRQTFRKSATAQIMDWADDITFAIHDLLDFYCAGRIPIDRCKLEDSSEKQRLIRGIFKRKSDWMADRKKYIMALDQLLRAFNFEPHERYKDTAEHRSRIYDFATALIRPYVGAISISRRSTIASPVLEIDDDAKCGVEVLKQFIWEYIIENPDLAWIQRGQRNAIRIVFRQLLQAARRHEFYFFPLGFQEIIESASTSADHVRIVADCVASMTEREVMRLYHALCGL